MLLFAFFEGGLFYSLPLRERGRSSCPVKAFYGSGELRATEGKGVGGKLFCEISTKIHKKIHKKIHQKIQTTAKNRNYSQIHKKIHKNPQPNDNSYTTNFHKKLNQIFVSFLNQNEN